MPWGKELKRKFGEYKCPQCNRSWKSANSFENFTQTCQQCNTEVHAHNMRPLARPDGLDDYDSGKAHPRHLCELCRKGYNVCGGAD